MANGYFLHPQKEQEGVLKRNTLLLSGCLDSGNPFSDFLGRRTRAAEVLTYADVWATMETAGRAAGTGTGSKLKIEFSGQGAGEDGQHRQAR